MTIRMKTVACLLIAAGSLAACAGTPVDGGGPVALTSSPERSFGGDDASVRVRLAAASYAAGNVSAAVRLYREVTDREPQNGAAWLGLGDALVKMRSWDEAANAYERAAKASPRSSAPHIGLGRLYLQMQQPKPAMDRFTEAIALDPNDIRAHNGRGVALDLLGRHDEAAAEYQKVLALKPGDRNASNNLALSLAFAGQASEAVQRLERMAQAADTPPRIRQNLALALGLSGDTRRARSVASFDLTPAEINANERFVQTVRPLLLRRGDGENGAS